MLTLDIQQFNQQDLTIIEKNIGNEPIYIIDHQYPKYVILRAETYDMIHKKENVILTSCSIIKALKGKGKEIWKNDNTDDYIRELRNE